MQLDEYGRATDCFAFGTKGGMYYCSALKDFYNSPSSGYGRCENCPFYKTEDEYIQQRGLPLPKKNAEPIHITKI